MAGRTALAIKIDDQGHSNRVTLPPDGAMGLHGTIVLRGNNNKITIDPASRGTNILFDIGSQCEIEIGSHCNLGHLFIFGRSNARIGIGSQSSFNGLVRLMCHEPTSLTIGSGCLFAGEVEVSTSDMHSLIDAKTGARINPAHDITIEEHVWIGQRAMILKGAHIGAGSVIGAGGIVTGTIPRQCVAVGNPARVVRQGVTWRFDLI
jgi:acetyltransferase-like isoleucine patch superfamily enzyme